LEKLISLEYLHINLLWCNGLTEEALMKFKEVLVKLSCLRSLMLNCRGCEGMDDTTLLSLSEGLKGVSSSLQSLSLDLEL